MYYTLYAETPKLGFWQNKAHATKAVVSFMPTTNYLPKWMKIKNCLDYYSDMFSDFSTEKAAEKLKFMELEKDMKISSLSSGMLASMFKTYVLMFSNYIIFILMVYLAMALSKSLLSNISMEKPFHLDFS